MEKIIKKIIKATKTFRLNLIYFSYFFIFIYYKSEDDGGDDAVTRTGLTGRKCVGTFGGPLGRCKFAVYYRNIMDNRHVWRWWYLFIETVVDFGSSRRIWAALLRRALRTRRLLERSTKIDPIIASLIHLANIAWLADINFALEQK